MLSVLAVVPNIKAEFASSNAGSGVAVTVMWFVYGASQFPAGLLIDLIGERLMLLAAMALGGFTAASFALSQSFIGFVITAGIFGIIGGLFAIPRVTLFSRQFPEDSGTAIGLVMSFGNVGAALLPAGIGVIAAAVGWRFGFAAAIPIFLMALFAIYFVIPCGTSEGVGDRHSVRELLPRVSFELRNREIVLVTAAVFK